MIMSKKATGFGFIIQRLRMRDNVVLQSNIVPIA
jgi:hypothetical protein